MLYGCGYKFMVSVNTQFRAKSNEDKTMIFLMRFIIFLLLCFMFRFSKESISKK